MRDGHYALSEKAKRTYERVFNQFVAEVAEAAAEADQALADQTPQPGQRTYHYEDGRPVLDDQA